MSSHAKASMAGTARPQPSGLGRSFSGALATRGSSFGGKGSGAPFSRFALVLALFALVLLTSASAASAAVPHRAFKEVFGSAEQPTLGKPAGMAVDPATGDVYVIEFESRTLSRWNPDGTPANFGAIEGGTSNIIDGSGEPGEDLAPNERILSNESSTYETEVSIAPPGSAAGTAGNIYVTNAADNEIDVFASSGEYLGNFEGSYPCGVSVGPDGDVYAGSYYEGIYKLEPTGPGQFAQAAGSPFPIPAGLGGPCQVAAGYGPSAGSIFVAGFLGPTAKVDAVTGNAEYEVFSGSTGSLSTDTTTGHLFLTIVSSLGMREFDASGSAADEVSSTELSSEPAGVAVNGATESVYTTRSSSAQVEVFGELDFGSELTVEVEGDGTVEGGSAAEPATIDCGTGATECTHSYGEELVTLEAQAGSHSEFSGWSGDCDTVAGATCEVTMDAAKTVKAEFDSLPYDLEVELTGPGKVSGGPISECEEAAGTCSGLVDEGEAVTLTATLPAHYAADWSGVTCTVETATECQFAMPAADTKVEVEASLEPVSLGISIIGNASAQCEDVTAGGGLGACAPTYPYGHTVKAAITPKTNWELTGLSGSGSAAGDCSFSAASGSCEFALEEASTVSATAVSELGISILSVFKGGNGQGTVTSNPAGINCGTEPCEEEFAGGETIELQATPAAGSVFGGWLGCHPVAGEPSKCHVTLNGPEVDVTAIFLVEGKTGETPTITEFAGNSEPAGNPCGGRGGVKIATASETKYVCNGTIGEDGKGIVVTPTAPGCAAGGITVEVEGQPSSKQEICNGRNGQIGFPGAEGPAGATGPQGSTGATGAPGKQGAQGAPGAQGPKGPQGKRGPAGKVTVTCKVKGPGKVTCEVRQAGSGGKASKRGRVRWKLMAAGHVVSHGRTTVQRLNRVLAELNPGRYVLHVEGGTAAIAVPTDGGSR